MGYRISGETISAFKPGDRALEQPLRRSTGSLSWAKVLSPCVKPGGLEVGTWFEYRPKSPQATIRVRVSGVMGNMTEPILYMGVNKPHKGQDLLTELDCVKAEKGQTEILLSFNDLTPKETYFILVGSETANKNDSYTIHVWTAYTDLAKAEDLSESASETYVSGRVRDKSGTGKSGVLISILDKSNKPLETAKSDSKGTFTFKKLPIDSKPIIRIEEDDTELIVDLFLFGSDGKVKEKATRVGNNMYGFGADEDHFTQLRLLSDRDWSLNVEKGKTGVTGRVVDSESFLFGQANVSVGLYSTSKNKLASSKTDLNGKFSFKDLDQGDYMVRVEGDQSKNYSEIVMVDDLNVPFYYANSAMIGKDGFFKFEKLPVEIVELKRAQEKDTRMKIPTDFSSMESGKAIVLKDLLFESGSSTILTSSYSELNKLAEELKKKPSLRIEISGHTDNTGNNAANLTLSTGRAESVKQYLVEKGVNASRVECKGFGDTRPVASNDTEEGRTKNRRVEFVVIK